MVGFARQVEEMVFGKWKACSAYRKGCVSSPSGFALTVLSQALTLYIDPAPRACLCLRGAVGPKQAPF